MTRQSFIVLAIFAISAVTAVGGWREIDPSDTERMTRAQEVADFAVKEIARRTNSPTLKLIRVFQAEYQIVAGINYRLLMELSSEDQGPVNHTVVVWDHFGDLKLTADEFTLPPENGSGSSSDKERKQSTRGVQDLLLSERIRQDLPVPPVDLPSPLSDPEGSLARLRAHRPQRTQRSPLPGSWVEIDLSANIDGQTDRAMTMANWATEALNGRSNSIDKFSFRRVIQAYQQVVAGLKFRLLLELEFQGKSVYHAVYVLDQFGDKSLLSDTEVGPEFRFRSSPYG